MFRGVRDVNLWCFRKLLNLLSKWVEIIIKKEYQDMINTNVVLYRWSFIFLLMIMWLNTHGIYGDEGNTAHGG